LCIINNLTISVEFVLTNALFTLILLSMVKAIAYLRVSGRGQVEGDGFTRQLTAIEKYAAANDFKIIRVFQEEGVSGGTEWENRPAFSEMMALLLSNGVRTVLVERLDRVARDLLVQESVIGDFQRKNLSLISVSEPDLLSDDPSRVLMRQMLGAFFQYEKTLLVAKLRGARQRIRAKQGHCEGRKQYGTRPGETDVIERMKRLRETGMAVDKIADALNRDAIKPRAGLRWYATSVSRVLKAGGALQKHSDVTPKAEPPRHKEGFRKFRGV
jgi:DNA invertase Pin-like site-specific DNA recombinase